MLKVKIIAVQENEFNDKYNPGQKVKMSKVTFLMQDSIAEMWTNKQVAVGDEITLTIGVGKNFKPVVKIV